MLKQKLKFLILIPFLLGSSIVLSMYETDLDRGYGYHWDDEMDSNIDNENVNATTHIECPICMDESDQFHTLSCGHSTCINCRSDLLDNAFKQNQLEQLRCPDPRCQENFTDEDYITMMPFAKNTILKIRRKLSGKNEPQSTVQPNAGLRTKLWLLRNAAECPKCGMKIIKSEGCNHMTCQSPRCTSHFCWICGKDWNYNGSNGYQYHANCPRIIAQKRFHQILATITTAGAVATYGFYRLCKSKKVQTITKNSLNWISKKYSNNKQNIKEKISKTASIINNKSPILFPVTVGTGLFGLLHMNSVNFGDPINNYLVDNYGSIYWNITHKCDNNKFLRVMQNQFDRGNLINGGLSISGGLLAGYIYRQFSNKIKNLKGHSNLVSRKQDTRQFIGKIR